MNTYRYRSKALQAAYQAGKNFGQSTRHHIESECTFVEFVKDVKPQVSSTMLRQAWNQGERDGYESSGVSIMKLMLTNVAAFVGVILLMSALVEGWWLMFRPIGSSLFFPL